MGREGLNLPSPSVSLSWATAASKKKKNQPKHFLAACKMGTTLPWRRGDGGNIWGERAKKSASKGTAKCLIAHLAGGSCAFSVPVLSVPRGRPILSLSPVPELPTGVARGVWFGLTQSNLLYSRFPGGGLKHPRDLHHPRHVLLHVAEKAIFFFPLKRQFDGKFLLSVSAG